MPLFKITTTETHTVRCYYEIEVPTKDDALSLIRYGTADLYMQTETGDNNLLSVDETTEEPSDNDED